MCHWLGWQYKWKVHSWLDALTQCWDQKVCCDVFLVSTGVGTRPSGRASKQGFTIQSLSTFLLGEGSSACPQPLILTLLMVSASTTTGIHSVWGPLSVAVTKYLNSKQCSRRKGFISFYTSGSVIEKNQGWNSRQEPESRNHGIMLLSDLLSGSCLASFLTQPRTTYLRNGATHKWAKPSYIMMIPPPDMPTADLDNSSIEPSPLRWLCAGSGWQLKLTGTHRNRLAMQVCLPRPVCHTWPCRLSSKPVSVSFFCWASVSLTLSFF